MRRGFRLLGFSTDAVPEYLYTVTRTTGRDVATIASLLAAAQERARRSPCRDYSGTASVEIRAAENRAAWQRKSCGWPSGTASQSPAVRQVRRSGVPSTKRVRNLLVGVR